MGQDGHTRFLEFLPGTFCVTCTFCQSCPVPSALIMHSYGPPPSAFTWWSVICSSPPAVTCGRLSPVSARMACVPAASSVYQSNVLVTPFQLVVGRKGETQEQNSNEFDIRLSPPASVSPNVSAEAPRKRVLSCWKGRRRVPSRGVLVSTPSAMPLPPASPTAAMMAP